MRFCHPLDTSLDICLDGKKRQDGCSASQLLQLELDIRALIRVDGDLLAFVEVRL
jgi:hypothetical protein